MQPSATPQGHPVILLSFFDGIGTAAYVLKELGFRLQLFLAWEIDPDCIKVVESHHPEAQNRGDFTADNARQICDAIRAADPEQKTVVLFTGGPPCPDFSPIKGDEGLGRQGAEGKKFDEM